MDFLASLLNTSDFPARWHCGRWTPQHGWLHIASDLAIWGAYFTIPLILMYFIVRKADVPFRRIFFLFGAFILFCGTTHLMEAIIFWHPMYRLAGVIKFFTAVVSWATVLALVPILPLAFAMRSPAELEREIAARQQAEAELKRANASLDERVRERTAQLLHANETLQKEREWFQTTLASIGDAVIATDPQGIIKFLNPVAERLTGWEMSEATGQPLENVFHIVNEQTLKPVSSPVVESVRTGMVVGLANHTLLLAKDGTQRPIEDSAAPITDQLGDIAGVVLVFRDVTERRLADQAIREREAQFRVLADSAPVLIWLNSTHGAVFVNRAYLDFLGCSMEDVRGMDWAARLHPGDTEEYLREYQQAFDRRERFDARFRFRRHDGEYRWLQSVGLPRYEADGSFAGYVGCSFDVTEIVDAELQQKTLAAQRQLALNAARLGWWSYDPHSQLVHHDDRYAEIYGIEQRKWTIEETSQLLHPDDARRVMEAIEAAIDPVDPQTYLEEYRVLRPDGSVCWVQAHGLATFTGDGPARRLNNFVGTVADVTERREAEQSLRNSEERFRLATSAGQVGIWEWNIVNDTVSWSESLYALHGVSRDEFPGTVAAFTQLIHPPDVERVKNAIESSLQRNMPYEIEFRAVRPDGDIVWLYTQATLVRSPSGSPVRMLGATVNITERKRAEEALKETDRRKDEFLATLAHELRNPLAPIRTAVQILHLTDSQEPESRKIREMVERQVDHLVRLVDDLLDMSRISRGKVELRRLPMDLADAVQAAVESSAPLIVANHHELTVVPSKVPLIVHGDLVRLTQVVANLLNNAAKYTPHGGNISLSTQREDQQAVIRVQDNGLGIPSEMLESVFEMFAQVNRHLGRAQGGLGIGLTLVRQLVELHQGSVQAYSAGEGKGSEFVVRIPLIAAQSNMATSETQAGSIVTARRILVVDDNADAATSLSRLISLNGHQVKTAHDGPTGLQEFEAFQPDVVLLDLGMPGLDGYETARQIRASAQGHGVLLIALTGWGQEEDRRRTKESGFDYHLVKPLNFSDLQMLLQFQVPGAHLNKQS